MNQDTASQKTINYPYIDALRGIAISGVILIHSCGFDYSLIGDNLFRQIFYSIINSGARGVQLFFLASAFTIFLSYKRKKTNSWEFYARRFFRIAPLYYLGIIYFLIQNGSEPNYWLGDLKQITNLNILSNVFFIHGVNPYWINSVVPGGWSITVEVTFYLIVPFLNKVIRNANDATTFTLISMIVSIILGFVFRKIVLIPETYLWENYTFLFFPSQLPVFGMGIMVYFFVIENDINIDSKNFIVLSLVLFGHLLGVYVIGGHIFYGVGFMFLFVGLSKFEWKLLVNKFTTFLGKLSYSAYFVHFAIIYWVKRYDLPSLWSFGIDSIILKKLMFLLLILFFTLVVSSFMNKYVEVPFQRFGKKIINRIK